VILTFNTLLLSFLILFICDFITPLCQKSDDFKNIGNSTNSFIRNVILIVPLCPKTHDSLRLRYRVIETLTFRARHNAHLTQTNGGQSHECDCQLSGESVILPSSQCLFKILLFFVELHSIFRTLFVHFVPAFIMTRLNDIAQTTSFLRICTPAHYSTPEEKTWGGGKIPPPQ